jgi:2-polyprenyl-3-methyl-5-hydroxy-6-metoxy-1,4-benzoquinol methylase
MLWIISGPSSVGKSTFIRSKQCFALTGLRPKKTLVIKPMDLPDRLDPRLLADVDCFVHYNMLRPVSLFAKHEATKATSQREYQTRSIEFMADPWWNEFSRRTIDKQKRAVVLVASVAAILERVGGRRGYNIEYWRSLYEKLNLPDIYRAWCSELERRQIPFVFMDATGSTYPVLDPAAALEIVQRNVTNTTYSKQQIEKILQEERFAYHRVNLPFGLHTRGRDRSRTRDLIFRESLTGKSVLDVGSALGYFCFEAEARGATRVLGIERNEERFRQACLLKQIIGSRVEFLQRDILQHPLDEKFDHVCLLNVLHHLDEPIRAIHLLAPLAREMLVIEFPTIEDAKFRKTTRIRFPKHYNRLPLMGVSSKRGTSKKIDGGQTFVFTPPALIRILQDHQPLFREVEIIDSPVRGRKIALCRR